MSQGNDPTMNMQANTSFTAFAIPGGTMTAGLTSTVKPKTVKTLT
jgi:hypothetical protein